MKEQRQSSISTKITVLLLSMVMLSTASIGLLSWWLHRADSITSSQEAVMYIAGTTVAAIEGDAFEQTMRTLEKDEGWYRAKQTIDNVKLSTKIQYIYVLGAEYQDEVIYYAEGFDPAVDDVSLDLGETESVSVHSDEMFNVLATGEPMATDIYDAEEFGIVLSGYAPIKNSAGQVVGVVGADLNVDQVLAESAAFGMRIILIGLSFILAFGGVCVWLTRRMIGKPVGQLTRAAKSIAMGDMDVEMNIHSSDEIGQLARAFEALVQSNARQIAVLRAIAEGNLAVDVQARGEKDGMSHAIERTIGNLDEMFASIRESAAQVSAVSSNIAAGAQSLSSGASQQAQTMEDLAGNIGRVAQAARGNVELAQRAVALAESIKASAQEGASEMESMIDAVREIDRASQAVSNVMKIIDEIASQTNLLAINASVEAAHAGQAGASFAVVATEVRQLAAKSAASAKDTAALVQDTLRKTSQGVKIAERTAGSIRQIVEGIDQSSTLIQGIAQASNAQDTAIEEINLSVAQVAAVVQMNSDTAQQSAAASQEMNGQADALNAMLDRFQLRGEDEARRQRKALGSGTY